MWRSLKSTCLRWRNNHAVTLACQHGSNIDTVNGVRIINDHTLDGTTIPVEHCVESSITRCKRNIVRYLSKYFLEPECSVSTTKKIHLRLLTVDDTRHCRDTELRILRRTTYIIHIEMIRRLKCLPHSTRSPVSISHIHTKALSRLFQFLFLL